MHLPSIKLLIENNEIAALETAEVTLLEGNTPEIEIPGADEGEQLTHILAAIWVKKEMQKEDVALNDALRTYTARVRNSIN